jgi:hypothetical protein
MDVQTGDLNCDGIDDAVVVLTPKEGSGEELRIVLLVSSSADFEGVI